MKTILCQQPEVDRGGVCHAKAEHTFTMLYVQAIHDNTDKGLLCYNCKVFIAVFNRSLLVLERVLRCLHDCILHGKGAMKKTP